MQIPAASADLIERTADFVREKFQGEGSGHDWEHIRRVWQTTRSLAQNTPAADGFVAELGALLHDVADWKFHGGDEEAGPRAARAWLLSQQADEAVIQRVETIIREISFKGLGVATPMSTLEGELVQDADRLDAIGAIGVARAFAYGGHKGRPLHDPAVAPVEHSSFEAYKRNAGPTINHFYEKLLHLRERLNTPAAKMAAESRHAYVEQFLAQFLREWNGEDLPRAEPG
ncbi:HD domain-containing protein [Hymenobacter busanensis]|uniref:HD domain-containing protein n=1 Tax=Hymenobacter busanensis TaxID=2607656 RepID=A0A7L4ZVW6_9BACT|nr:HD domain-containing protein [Hymenobacter busanensis]KAA9339881.1 HD domain-containing protein [Hymenobacter busanensis]QHJ06362.1 HD domain-containing protein [Hymenobacter busanensis]